MAIFISFGIFKNFRKKEVVQEGHKAYARVGGMPTLPGRAPLSRGHLICLPDSIFLHVTILVGKKSLYILSKVLTTVSRKYPLFSFRVVHVAD